MKHWLLLTTLLISTLTTWADAKEFIRDYTYVAGEADSKISARQMAMQEVKRELLNEIGTHIYSRVDISENSKNKSVAKQEIRAMTAGFVKVDVLEEKWDGYEFYIKAKMVAAPEEILKRIKDLASNDEEKIQLKDQLIQSAKAFEDLRLEMLALKKSLEESQSIQDKQSLVTAYTQKSLELSLEEVFDLGSDYYFGRKGTVINFTKAFKLYRDAADRGHPVAQNNLGVMYVNGEGVKQSYKEAYLLWSKAANQGLAHAQYGLGNLYIHGLGVEGDMNRALEWHLQAATQDFAPSQVKVGMFLEIKGEYQYAENFYRLAADTGYAVAQFKLGMFLDEVKGEHQLAEEYYRLAADSGYAVAQFRLGEIYSDEISAKDFQEASKWFLMAASQGHAEAQHKLAFMYWNRQITGESADAVPWFIKSAENGYVEAQVQLGSMYLFGEGVALDAKLAHIWYEKAAAQGHEGVIEFLKTL
ncbi:MAG: SEL1-like repeat protein [Cycloclasticus sp.]